MNNTVFIFKFKLKIAVIFLLLFLNSQIISSNSTFFKLYGHRSYISSLAFSPDNNYLASVSTNRDKVSTIKIWDIKTRKKINEFKIHDQSIRYIKFTPNGKYLVSAGWSLILWDLDSQSIIERRTIDSFSLPRNTFSFSKNGKYIVLPYYNKFEEYKEIKVYDWNNRTKAFEIEQPTGSSLRRSVNNAIFVSDDEFILGTTSQGILVWDNFSGKITDTITFKNRDYLFSYWKIAANYNTEIIMHISELNKDITFFDFASKEIFQDITNTDFDECIFCPSGKYIICNYNHYDAENIVVFDWQKEKEIRKYSGLRTYSSFAISNDGKLLAATGPYNNILVWKTPSKLSLNINLHKAQDIESKILRKKNMKNEIIESKLQTKITDLLKPRGEFETSDEYQKRVKYAKEGKNEIKNELERKFHGKLDSLKNQQSHYYNKWVNLIKKENEFLIDSLHYNPDDKILNIKLDYTDYFIEAPLNLSKAKKIVPKLRNNPHHIVYASFYPDTKDVNVPIIKKIRIPDVDNPKNKPYLEVTFSSK